MHFTKILASLVLVAATGIAQAADQKPAKLGDYQPVGFLSDYSQLRPEGGDSSAYVLRASKEVGAKYNKVLIDRIKIFFEDEAEYKGVDPTDLKALTDYFHDAIVKALGDAYPVVEEPGPDVVHLRIAVTNVVPNKPEASVVTLVVPFLWVADAGSGVAKGEAGSTAFVGKASVEMEALDSLTSKQLAAYVETEIPKKYNWTQGVSKGVTSYTNAYSTWAYTKQSMDVWAKYIRERLDVVHGK
jgi:hypothetical protein